MDFFSETLSKLFGPLLPLAQPLLPLILGRLIGLQGYLHSDVSGKIRLTLNRSVNDGPGRLVLKNVESLSTTKFIRKQNRILLQNHKYLRAFPLLFLTRKSKIGHGNHYGGTFPMKKNPKRLESDLLGRVKGWKQVHIVDSSTFPSIPPGPIVLTIMANAYRISQASTLE
jgi:choline dehydrogenase-like flavoprotein